VDADRRKRAEARKERAILHKTTLGSQERDLSPVKGAEGIALALQLTRESYALSGQPIPQYTRAETPYRFVPWPKK
jgi:hypothetical protein